MTITYRKVQTGNRYGDYWTLATIAEQPKPYTRPLKYSSRGGKWFKKDPAATVDIRNRMPLANNTGTDGYGGVVTASNKALNKLYDRLEQSEALLVAWKERQGALDLVTSNVRRLVTIARAVKRRDPKIVRRVLKRNPAAKDIVKSPSGLWLEYHFAIVPTIMDIHHACGVLGFEFPVEKLIVASAAETVLESGGGQFAWHEKYEYESIVKLTGEIYSLNPNLILASQLGFGQPLSVAWEMTPFSWFIDYFVNVGDLVKNLQPRFPGVKTRNHTTTKLVKCYGRNGYRNKEPLDQVNYNVFESFHMTRSLSWPSFQLEFNSPFDLKGQQCSYIVAVLGQILVSMKPKS